MTIHGKIYSTILVALLFGFTGKGFGQIYQHNFGTTTISAYPYTVAPSIIDANLSNSSWTNNIGAWTSYAGSSGQALGLANSGGTPQITLNVNVASGDSLSLSSFSFWCQRSVDGAQNWSMAVNGIAAGSGIIPTTGANTGILIPTNIVSGLTGTITVILSLSGASGTGSFSLDDFTLNGSIRGTASCSAISTFPWSENFDAMTTIGTDVTPGCWVAQPTAIWASMNATSNTYNGPNSSPNFMTCFWNPYSSVDKYLITPGFALTSGVPYTFNFNWAGDGYSGWDADVRYNTSQTGTGSTLLDAAFLTNGTTTTSSYTNVARTFTPGFSGTYYFMVHVANNITPYDLGFDDFSLTAGCSKPTMQATNVSENSTCITQVTLNWTRGTGDGCAVFMYKGNSGAAAPVDGTTYTANATFGSGTQIGSSGWYCIYSGTGSSVEVTGLTASSAYRVHVCEYSCAGASRKYNVTNSTSNPNNTPTSATPCHCAAGSSYQFHYISNVQVGNINNASSSKSGGYADYTIQSTTMIIGTSYTITINGDGNSHDKCGIWVDWNQDGDFIDANETIAVSNTPGSGPYTATITPPSGATTGNAKMRIRLVYPDTTTLSPCGSVWDGEVEDYTINVQSVPANDQCSGAIAVSCGDTITGTTIGATTTNDPTTACGVAITSPGVWYSFSGTGQEIIVSLCGSTLPTSLNVYSGTCSSLTCIGGNEDNVTSCGNNNAYYTFTSVNGTQYYFFIHGTGTTTGVFKMAVSCINIPIPNCPSLTTPANGATNVKRPTSLNWTAPISGGPVTYYKLYFGTDTSATNIYNGINIGNVLTYSPTSISDTTKYYWKVTSVNSTDESSGCTINNFTTTFNDTLTVDNTTYTPMDLTENYLISGCLNAANIKFTGNSKQIGYFHGGNSTLGISEGLVLSTGNAKDAEGPNSSANKSTNWSGAGDATIASMIGISTSTTYDAAALEFDFKPSSDTVSFKYCFASEEYNEYVNTAYNDAFGLFISGGPQSYSNKNIALIPGTSIPVSINNVNKGPAAAGQLGTGPGANTAYYRDNADGHINIQCDGLTTVLTATIAVTAYEWYHMKLVVADVSDGIYDSWVFLGSNSFTSGNCVSMKIKNPVAGKDSWEGSNSAITFSRANTTSANKISSANTRSNDSIDVRYPIAIKYTLGGTATQGLDYDSLPNPFIIPAGDTSITYTLHTLKDSLTEGTETIIFSVNDGWNLQDTIFLHDFVGVSGYIKESDTTICQGKTVTLHGIVTAGNYYQCTWSSGTTLISHSQNITITPSVATTYNFSVKDSCGNSFNKTVSINVNPIPPAPTITLNGNILESSSTTGNQWYSDSGLITGATSQLYLPTFANNYYVIVTDAFGCISDTSNIIYYIILECKTYQIMKQILIFIQILQKMLLPLKVQ